ncbi:uncharacterized protein PHLOEM PROTEIN 2-LIKE A4-like [Aristolochia californica]|uniref:uncharacterized protein PHLOEM PROTEIN 2-LIKE A4-like n=1 Tax=Aristolochia californica TaxID=171875 RepID=UPI0035D6441D
MALNIVWGNDRRYWKWTPPRNQEGPKPQDAAELLQVNWFQVTGRVDCSKISNFFDFPRSKTYEIFQVVKFNIDAFGWHKVPIKFKVVSDGRCRQRAEKLEAYRRNNNQWHEIKGGEFTVVHGRKGLVDIGMFETESDWWKGGMVLSAVKIKAKA